MAFDLLWSLGYHCHMNEVEAAGKILISMLNKLGFDAELEISEAEDGPIVDLVWGCQIWYQLIISAGFEATVPIRISSFRWSINGRQSKQLRFVPRGRCFVFQWDLGVTRCRNPGDTEQLEQSETQTNKRTKTSRPWLATKAPPPMMRSWQNIFDENFWPAKFGLWMTTIDDHDKARRRRGY